MIGRLGQIAMGYQGTGIKGKVMSGRAKLGFLDIGLRQFITIEALK
jgi:hypothetical protein